MRIPGKIVITLVLGTCSPLLSTTASADEPMLIQFNGGYVKTVGETSNYLQGHWTLGTGLTFQPDWMDNLAFQVDLAYADFGVKHDLITLGQQNSQYRIDDGSGSVWSLTTAAKYTVPFSDGVHGYGLLGIGAYQRHVELTQTVLYGGYYCDPWWGYCYPGLATGDAVVASTTTTKFGWNVGLGIEFPFEERGAWFIEARYHSIDTSHATEFMPIQIGIRF